jgi:ParB family chromosome partitioning protein
VGKLAKMRAGAKAHRVTDRDVARLQEDLSQKLGTTVVIRSGARKGSGKLLITFNSLDQLDAILARL